MLRHRIDVSAAQLAAPAVTLENLYVIEHLGRLNDPKAAAVLTRFLAATA